MPRFAANLSTLFTDVPMIDRFERAAKAGFRGVEIQFPYMLEPEKLGDKLAMNGLELAMFNAPPGDWQAGERGLAALPGREEEFRDSLEIALRYAELTDCTRIHVMAGVVPEEQWEDALDTYMDNIGYAADEFHRVGVKCLIEPINPIDMPGYFLTRPDDAVNVLTELENRNLFIQYDVYHAQITQGGITDFIESHLEQIAHIQIAGVPGRHEPDRLSELNYDYLFNLLDGHGYPGWIGCEYKPRGKTEDGLRWAKDWLNPRG
ncbi:2-oxo-tetronate isomerase [Novispirillum sp. DQ9]|uniref:2-oxo-tetronate isomerase n=1 Tax=Novispirillum sp. DQ9 TaxID=3398612 RepID=UPI003C7C7254